MAPVVPIPSARCFRRWRPHFPQGVQWMAPLAPAPSARPGTHWLPLAQRMAPLGHVTYCFRRCLHRSVRCKFAYS